MRFPFVALLIFVSLLMISTIGCDGDGPTDNEPRTINLSGTVYSYVCIIPDSADMANYDFRYTVGSGRLADIRLFRDGVELLKTTTDDSSTFNLNLQVGTYTLAVETDFTVPEVLSSITLTTDTVIDILTQLRFESDDAIIVTFTYLGLPLPDAIELDSLNALNEEVGRMLNLSSPSYTEVNNSHVYRIPLAYGYRPWQFAQAIYPRRTSGLSVMWAQPIYRSELCPDVIWVDWDGWNDSIGNGIYTPPEPIIDTIP